METTDGNINKFSWRRAYDFGMMYKGSIKSQLILFAIITVLVYLCLLSFYDEIFIGIYTLLSFIVGYMLYLGSLAFARRDDSLITQVPAKVSEKFVFYILYSLIFVPLFVEAIWLALNYGAGAFYPDFNIEKIVRSTVYEKYKEYIDDSTIYLTVVNSVVQSMALILTVTYVVLRSNSHRMLKGILTPLMIIIFVGIISGIAGIIIGFSVIDKMHPENSEFVAYLLSKMSLVTIALVCLILVYSAFMLCCIYRRIKLGQVSR